MAQSETTLLQIDKPEEEGLVAFLRKIPMAVVRFGVRKPLGGVSLVVLFLMIIISIFAPYIAPHDPYELDFMAIQEAPGRYILGTDATGRDVLSRIIYGGRISVLVGFLSVGIGTMGGALLGVASGYLSGKFDLVSQRFIEILLSFPGIILALILLAAFGMGMIPTIAAIAITRLPQSTRVIRSVALSVREFDYVTAARAVGASDTRIMLRHVLPQCVAPILIVASAHLGIAIIIEASLGFLGVGIPAPTPTWGNMVGDRSVTITLFPPWWLVVFPGIPIFMIVLAFNLFGDALRDVLDPRLRGSESVRQTQA